MAEEPQVGFVTMGAAASEGDIPSIGIGMPGYAFMGTAQWRGHLVMRVSVCSIATTEEDARITVDAVRSAWEAVRAGG